jgi:hypothetical protein
VVSQEGELSQQLRQSCGHDGEFGDDSVELGRAGQRRWVLGAVVQLRLAGRPVDLKIGRLPVAELRRPCGSYGITPIGVW